VEPETILCICTSGVGNAIMFTPVITNLRLHYPKSRILFMGSPSSVQVVIGSDAVDEIVEYKIEHRLEALLEARRVRPNMAVVSFSDRGIFISFVTRFSGAKVRAGFVYKNRRRFYNYPLFIDNFCEKHEVHHNLDLCRILDVPIVSKDTFFTLRPEDDEFAQSWLDERQIAEEAIVGMHPGSNPRYTEKRWPAERFGQLSSILAENGFKVIVFGGPGEEGLFNRIRDVEPSTICAVGIGLKSSAAIIKRCSGFVANDSGFMHIAYTLGVPTLGIVGPTPEVRYGPLGTSSVVTAPVNCRPCYRGQKTIECEHINCLNDIGVDQVAGEFFRLLDRASEDKNRGG